MRQPFSFLHRQCHSFGGFSLLYRHTALSIIDFPDNNFVKKTFQTSPDSHHNQILCKANDEKKAAPTEARQVSTGRTFKKKVRDIVQLKFYLYFRRELSNMAKEKIIIEYDLNNATPNSIWGFISSANGLADWFADKVVCDSRTYTFYWGNTQQAARKTGSLNGVFIRFKWLDEEDSKAYFEFRINIDELTNNVTLAITDFAEPDEKEECIDLWNEQVATLKRRLGS